MLVVSFTLGELSFLSVNMYNAGPGRLSKATQALLNSSLPLHTPTLVLGDFNLHHPTWAIAGAPARPPSAGANDLVEWAEANAFALLNSLEWPTLHGHSNQANSIIDLTWVNFAAANINLVHDWTVLNTVAYESDHNPICWTIRHPAIAQPNDDGPTGVHIDPSKRDGWCGAFSCTLAAHPPPAVYAGAQDVEAGAASLLHALTSATTEVMPARTGKAPSRSKWWNADCDLAMHALMDARGPQRDVLWGRLYGTIWMAKRKWATDIIQNTGKQEVWSLCQWASGNRR